MLKVGSAFRNFSINLLIAPSFCPLTRQKQKQSSEDTAQQIIIVSTKRSTAKCRQRADSAYQIRKRIQERITVEVVQLLLYAHVYFVIM